MVSKPTVSHTRNRLFLTDPYTYVLYVRPGEDIDDTYIEKIQLYKSEIFTSENLQTIPISRTKQLT